MKKKVLEKYEAEAEAYHIKKLNRLEFCNRRVGDQTVL